MPKLHWPEVHAIMECLGYFSDEPGSYITSGKVTGPKGLILGPLEDDEDIADWELADFLTEVVGLLEEDVRECIWPGRYS